MSRARRCCAVAVCLVIAAAACSPGQDDETSQSGERGAATQSPCRPDGEQKVSKALLSCGDTSVAFIQTPIATGTGVAVRVDDENYIVTNSHVVDPFDSADVSLGGTSDLGTLPIVGMDVAADISLLGPVDDSDDLEPLPLGDPVVEKGDDVFLVGYPGTDDVDEADLTITAGLVSRTREAEGWDQTYIQSDAVIGEGQSGGALFGESGELLGISGLAYDPSFALALTVQDVGVAVDRILAGDGDDVPTVPQRAEGAEGGATEGSVRFTDDIELPTLYLPAADEQRTWKLSVAGPAGRFGVAVYDLVSEEPIAQNAAGLALDDEFLAAEAARSGMSIEEINGGPIVDPPAEVAALETAPGVFEIDIEPGVSAGVQLSVAPDASTAELTWTSALPLWPLTEEIPVQTLTIDEPVEGVISGFRAGAPFEVQLEEGQQVEISASSPQGDLATIIAPPGQPLTSFDVDSSIETPGLTYFDDSGEGLYDLDVREPFTADAAGVYQLWVQSMDITAVAFRVSVDSAAD